MCGVVAVFLMALLLTTNGCAGLPDAEKEFRVAHVAPKIVAESQTGEGILGRHMLVEQAINADSPLVGGNRLQLLKDGPATYAAMKDAIRSATHHINFQTYIFEDDEVGREFADLLLQRQKDGVQINLMYDSFTSLTTSAEFFDRLRDGGIQLVEFNPINPLGPKSQSLEFNHRGHRKLLVVDGATAFVGGINISEEYSSGSFVSRSRVPSARPAGWRDTHLQISGPVVAEFQKLFHETWADQDGPPLTDPAYFPELRTQGNEIVRAIGSTPDDEHSVIYLTMLAAIQSAERSVYLTIAYFAPDSQFLDALKGAAKRGVDVKLVMPANSDSWPIFHVGRSYYEELLEAGVEIYERRGSGMHAKTAVIDGVWSTIGSSNIDWRSFLYNDELNAVVLGREFAGEMEAMFADDVSHSNPIELAQWRERPFPLRVMEWSAKLVERGL